MVVHLIVGYDSVEYVKEVLSSRSLIVYKQLHIYNSINTKGIKYNGLETMVNPRPQVLGCQVNKYCCY